MTWLEITVAGYASAVLPPIGRSAQSVERASRCGCFDPNIRP